MTGIYLIAFKLKRVGSVGLTLRRGVLDGKTLFCDDASDCSL